MSRPTSQIAEELEEKFRLCLPREVFVGVVVAAKHFAGTYRPCCPTVVSDVTMSSGPVKRRLFVEPPMVEEVGMISSEPPVVVELLAATDPAPSAVRAIQAITHVVAEPGDLKTISKTADDEWREDIWQSYGSREARLPSPIGCSRSPSVLFSVTVRHSGGPLFRGSAIPEVRHSGGPPFRRSAITGVRHSGGPAL